MTLFELVEVGIGIIFVWLLLSLASMTLQEWVAGWLRLRSSDLENQIRHLLNDPEEVWLYREGWLNQQIKGIVNQVRRILRMGAIQELPKNQIKLADAFYQHPVIKALSKEGRKPSYIPDRTFSLALFDVLINASNDGSVLMQELKVWEKMVDEKKLPIKTMAAVEMQLLEVEKLINDLSGQPEFRSKVFDQLETMVTVLQGKHAKLEPALEELRKINTIAIDAKLVLQGINHFWHCNPEIAKVINSFLPDVLQSGGQNEGFLNEMRRQLETWFNDSMNRLSGWYKRRAQLIGVMIGLFLAIIFNVDTISIADALWKEPIVREALVARAEAFEMPAVSGEAEVEGTDPEKAWETFYMQFEGMSLPLGWDYDEGTCKSESGETLGVNQLAFQFNQQCYHPVDMPVETDTSWNWFWMKFFGWVISGIASGQGATYWFDILKRLVNVRSSGKNPAEEKK